MACRNSLKSVLIDLSGTLHIENEVTPNAIEALKRLRSTNLKIKFVTNTTKESRRILHERLTKLGFDIEQEEIFTSLWAARDLIKKESLRPMYFLENAALEDFEGLQFEGNPNAVVIGLAPDQFNWTNLTKAFRLILDGAKLIAIHAARYYKTPDGLSLGPGPFVKALEYASGAEASIVGKPSANFFYAALDKVEPSEAVMIGDDVKDDIGGAQALGIKGYLVKTGKYRESDENKIDPSPYKTVNNFAEAVDDIVSSLNEDVSEHLETMIEAESSSYFSQNGYEDNQMIDSNNTGMQIKKEPDLNEDILQDDNMIESLAGPSQMSDVSFNIRPTGKRELAYDKNEEMSNGNTVKKKKLDEVLDEMKDDSQIFGDFVAAELRNIKSESNRKKLKRIILKGIIEVSESDG